MVEVLNFVGGKLHFSERKCKLDLKDSDKLIFCQFYLLCPLKVFNKKLRRSFWFTKQFSRLSHFGKQREDYSEKRNDVMSEVEEVREEILETKSQLLGAKSLGSVLELGIDVEVSFSYVQKFQCL